MAGRGNVVCAVSILLLASMAVLIPGCAHYKPTTTTAPIQALALDSPSGKLYIATLTNSRDSDGNPNGGGLGIYDLATHKFTKKVKSSGLVHNNIRDIVYDNDTRSVYISYYSAGARFSILDTLTDAIKNERIPTAGGAVPAVAGVLVHGKLIFLAGTESRDGHEQLFIDRFDPVNHSFARMFETRNERPDGASFGLSATALINDSIYMGLGPYQDKSALLRVKLVDWTTDRHELAGEIRVISGGAIGTGAVFVGTLSHFYIYDPENATVRTSSLPEGVVDCAVHGDRMYVFATGIGRFFDPGQGSPSIKDYDPENDTYVTRYQDVTGVVPAPISSLAYDPSGEQLFVGGAGLAVYWLSPASTGVQTYSYKDGLPEEGPGNYGPGFELVAVMAAVVVFAVLKRRSR